MMLASEVLRCSFPAWYEQFEKVTVESVVLPLPEEVLNYLRTEGSLVLPQECDQDNAKTESDGWEDEENDDSMPRPHFPEFSARVRDAMRRLGGRVFCKLNWSAPRDATWVAMGNSLACR